MSLRILPYTALLLTLPCVIGIDTIACADEPVADAAEKPPPSDLPPLERPGEPYRTPRSGEGFRTTVFGEEVEVEPRDRRRVSAWDIGFAATVPGATGQEVIPYGSLFFWRHPDDDTVFRLVFAGLYNEVFYAKSAPETPLEAVFTFENFTVPIDQSELVDGRKLKAEELEWGYVRPGIGGGWREMIAPGEQDNMASFTLTAEPGFYYFMQGHDTAPNFEEPEDSFDLRLHAQFRWDAMVRNLLELPHTGYALGADGVYGYRPNWEDWGRDLSEDAGDTRDYGGVTGYAVGVSPVPFVESERHRLVGYGYAGTGNDLDRFTSPRMGGGPTGEEYGSIWRPIVPGAAVQEFFPEHYAIAIGEYRFEPIFFSYLSIRTSVAWLDRDRRRSSGIEREDDVLASLGARITTGFVLSTRLQIDYNYSWGVIRKGEYGGSEVVFHLSSDF